MFTSTWTVYYLMRHRHIWYTYTDGHSRNRTLELVDGRQWALTIGRWLHISMWILSNHDISCINPVNETTPFPKKWSVLIVTFSNGASRSIKFVRFRRSPFPFGAQYLFYTRQSLSNSLMMITLTIAYLLGCREIQNVTYITLLFCIGLFTVTQNSTCKPHAIMLK